MGVLLPLQPPSLPVRRFTVSEYRRLAEVGILSEEERVELLEGWIVPKKVHNPPHDNAVELVDEALRAELPAGWRVRVQSSITTADSEPEPDVILVRGSARDRKGRHPVPSEVGLVVEVAESSLETDRREKSPALCTRGHSPLLDRQSRRPTPRSSRATDRDRRGARLPPGDLVVGGADGPAPSRRPCGHDGRRRRPTALSSAFSPLESGLAVGVLAPWRMIAVGVDLFRVDPTRSG